LLEFHRHLGTRELGAVDDIGPVDEFLGGTGVVAETLLKDLGHELGVALGLGIPEFLARAVGSKMLLVPWLLKGRYVVIEIPVELGVSGITEIEDGINVAREQTLVKGITALVGQALVLHLGLRLDFLDVE